MYDELKGMLPLTWQHRPGLRGGFRNGAGRGNRTPKGRSPANFECDATLLQLLSLQQFLRLAFDAAARSVQFGVVSCRPVEHTLRTPIRKLRARVDRLGIQANTWTFGGYNSDIIAGI